MRKKSHKNNSKAGNGKLLTGILVGGLVGATVGWLTAPAAGVEIRRRFRGEVMSARDKAKTAAGNVESRVRELAEEVGYGAGTLKQGSSSRRKRTAAARS